VGKGTSFAGRKERQGACAANLWQAKMVRREWRRHHWSIVEASSNCSSTWQIKGGNTGIGQIHGRLPASVL